jgi:hypothetical protein
MKLLSTLLLFFSIPGVADATIVLMKFTRDRVVVAADSRQRGAIGIDDSLCKVIQIDPFTFFFATGRATSTKAGTWEEIWSSFGVARAAYRNYQGLSEPYGFVRYIATWTEMMRRIYQVGLTVNQEALVTGLISKTISQGFFGRLDAAVLRVYLVQLNYALPPEVSGPMVYSFTREIHAGELSIFSSGDASAIALTTEFLANQTPRSKEANSKFGKLFHDSSATNYDAFRLQAAIQSAIEWIPDKQTIGGKVDVMTLDKGGTINWLSQKECSTGDKKYDTQK